ncbi:SRPBCC family protein [Hoyosella sp. YIM 151337]|uniref:SRPBCC family protein n=1 Tax=Hoyosella sp. YIM 151337 TaxID=2992742 RepID=UPI0022367307|nr:SRPBCC family protein [Hoyosella sp. YIM 151337]MCW4354228.1 SRPBCC family protein [Hoyosella sp. YIM 151337]
MHTRTRTEHLPVTVESPCTAPPNHTFSVIAPIELPQIFKAWGPLPGVTGVSGQNGAWDQAGRSRVVRFTDGGTARESLVEYTPPHSFAYEITEFTNTLRHAVQSIRGEWTITPNGRHSTVRWTYGFRPVPRRAWLLRTTVVPLWRRYAHRALALAVHAAETPQPPRPTNDGAQILR